MTQKHVSGLDWCLQTCESSAQKFRLAAQIRFIAFPVAFLIYSDACSHCSTETKGLLYPRQKRLGVLERFVHCLACHGELDYCLRLDELSANMYISACCSRSSSPWVSCQSQEFDTAKANEKKVPDIIRKSIHGVFSSLFILFSLVHFSV